MSSLCSACRLYFSNKMSLNICLKIRFLHYARLRSCLNSNFVKCNTRTCSTGVSKKKKLEDYFFDKKVQSILKKITGQDYDKIFRVKKVDIVPDKFKFVTEEKLKEMYESAKIKAAAKLQMPPVMEVREPIDEVLAKEPELKHYLDSKLVFIDTSPTKTARDRIMTVRETDGTLRKADWDERFRMNQIFFPMEGRELETPKFFENPYFDRLLDEESYEFVLDSACVQFEPDDPEYHRVTKETYEHIKNRKMFDVLRSTRHFGPMAFYFAVNKDIDSLLVDMLERQLISDAADTILLMYILNPELAGTSDKEIDDVEYVKEYVQKNKYSKAASLELALQTFLELQNNAKVENATS